MPGEITRIYGDTVKGAFLELADIAVATYLGDTVRPSDGTAWDRVMDQSWAVPYLPIPESAEMLVVTRYGTERRQPEEIVGASYLFPTQHRRLEISAADAAERYEDFWYRRILEHARSALENPSAVRVQAFRITQWSLVDVAAGNPFAYSEKGKVHKNKRYLEMPSRLA